MEQRALNTPLSGSDMKTSDIIWQNTQHEELLEILESFKSSPTLGLELVDKLDEYIDHHFRLEEKYMEVTAYPDIDRHKRLHRIFSENVKKMELSRHIIEEGFHDEKFRDHISGFLHDWLMKHLLGIDKELEAHILKSRLK